LSSLHFSSFLIIFRTFSFLNDCTNILALTSPCSPQAVLSESSLDFSILPAASMSGQLPMNLAQGLESLLPPFQLTSQGGPPHTRRLSPGDSVLEACLPLCTLLHPSGVTPALCCTAECQDLSVCWGLHWLYWWKHDMPTVSSVLGVWLREKELYSNSLCL
jgi:hypothetical protein